jgi:hypothetical protein
MERYDKVDVGLHGVLNPDTKCRSWGGFIHHLLYLWGELFSSDWEAV